jgi:hypothetical protein
LDGRDLAGGRIPAPAGSERHTIIVQLPMS